MDEFAEVIYHVENIPYFGRRVSYEWKGNKSLPFIVHMNFDENELDRLPWPIIKLYDDWSRGGGVYIRTDTYTWPIILIKHRALECFEWFYFRVLATARIWGLLDAEIGVRLTWRNLKVLRVFRKRGRR